MNDRDVQSNAQESGKRGDSVFRSPGFWLIVAFSVASAMGNALGTLFFLETRLPGEWGDLLVCSAAGFLVAQACLIAVWLTLGRQFLLVRMCLALGTLSALVCAYVLGLQHLELGRSSMPSEIPLIIAGTAFVIVGMISLPLALVRWRVRRFIGREIVCQNATAQFEIRHLFAATAGIALLVPLAQRAFSNGDFVGGAPRRDIISFIAIYMFLSCLTCLLSVALVFDEKRRVLNFPLLAAVILLGSPIATRILSAWFGSNFSRATNNSIVYMTSLSAALLFVLGMFFLFGYRLQKS